MHYISSIYTTKCLYESNSRRALNARHTEAGHFIFLPSDVIWKAHFSERLRKWSANGARCRNLIIFLVLALTSSPTPTPTSTLALAFYLQCILWPVAVSICTFSLLKWQGATCQPGHIAEQILNKKRTKKSNNNTNNNVCPSHQQALAALPQNRKPGINKLFLHKIVARPGTYRQHATGRGWQLVNASWIVGCNLAIFSQSYSRLSWQFCCH